MAPYKVGGVEPIEVASFRRMIASGPGRDGADEVNDRPQLLRNTSNGWRELPPPNGEEMWWGSGPAPMLAQFP